MSSFKAKMHQIRFRLGLRPRPLAGGAYSAPQTPYAGFDGAYTSKGREGIARGPRVSSYATENVIHEHEYQLSWTGLSGVSNAPNAVWNALNATNVSTVRNLVVLFPA